MDISNIIIAHSERLVQIFSLSINSPQIHHLSWDCGSSIALAQQNGQRLAAKEKGKGHKHHPLWTIRRARGLASPFDIPEVKHAISIGNLWSEPLVLIWEGEMSRLIILPSSTMVIKEMGEFAIVSAAHNVENVVSGPPTPFCRFFCERDRASLPKRRARGQAVLVNRHSARARR